jgi:SAM-dependent methyltransferase
MIIIIILLVLALCFAGILLFGAPYLPTLKPQIEVALELANLKKGQTILELGCGDGRVLIAAAKQGLNAVGYELNPILALTAWIVTLKYRKQVKVIWGDFWRMSWPETDAIFVFLLDRYMEKLNNKCIQYPKKPLKLVSFAFKISNRKPDKTKSGVFLYIYK